jgi:hypothetical protein
MFVGLNFVDGEWWAHHTTGQVYLDDAADLYRAIMQLVSLRPSGMAVRRISSGCFGLEPAGTKQLSHLAEAEAQQRRLIALDSVQSRFGKYAIMPARMLTVHSKGWLKDAIAFGGIGELEHLEFVEAQPEEIWEDAEFSEA